MATENYIDGKKGHGQIVLMLRLILASDAHADLGVRCSYRHQGIFSRCTLFCFKGQRNTLKGNNTVTIVVPDQHST